jgi:IrrE N-terminal-like domain
MEAAGRALETLIPRYAMLPLPVNPDSLAKWFGVEQTLEVEMAGTDGLLSTTASGQYVVSIRKGQSETRRRFTVAHELGHLIVHHAIGERRSEGKDGALHCGDGTREDQEEEDLCDILAAEILMPGAQFHRVIEEKGVSAQTIPDIARRFGVSVRAACRRIAGFLPYQLGIGMWAKESNGSVVPRWYEGKLGPKTLEHAIEPGSAGFACFDKGSIRGWHWIRLFGPMDKYFIDVSPLGNSQSMWLMVVLFDNAAAHIMSQLSRVDHLATRQMPLLDK